MIMAAAKARWRGSEKCECSCGGASWLYMYKCGELRGYIETPCLCMPWVWSVCGSGNSELNRGAESTFNGALSALLQFFLADSEEAS